jgi:hypothetical protein
MKYPEPQIGYYECECCLLDLYKIETEAHLRAVLNRIKDNDEVGPLMIFATLAEAVEALRGELSPAAEAEAFRQLGWHEK